MLSGLILGINQHRYAQVPYVCVIATSVDTPAALVRATDLMERALTLSAPRVTLILGHSTPTAHSPDLGSLVSGHHLKADNEWVVAHVASLP